MELKSVKAMKISDYFQYIKTKELLTYIKITPHQSTRNYKSIDLAKAINRCYKKIDKLLYKQGKTLVLEQQAKVAYYIYMSAEEGVQFYLIIPKLYEQLFTEKINFIWEQVELTVVTDIPRFSDKAIKSSLGYTMQPALSVDIADKKSQSFLNAQLNVVDFLKENDRVGIYYNFNFINSYGQMGFRNNYLKTTKNVKNGINVEKIKMNNFAILKLFFRGLVYFVDTILESASEVLSISYNAENEINELEKLIGVFNKRDLSAPSKAKGQLEVVDTQILLMSESKNKESAKMNLNSIIQAFSTLDGDNKLRPQTVRSKINLDNRKLPIQSNLMSVEEVGSLMQQPGRDLINKFKIESNSINEEEVPEVCQKGYISTGIATRKGKPKPTTLNPDPDQDTGLAVTGKQGSGKTEFVKNYSNCCVKRKYENPRIKHGDSLVVLDYIGNNDLANTIMKIVPKELLVLIDLSDEEKMESIAYPEKFYDEKTPLMEKLDIISEKTQLMVQLLNGFSYGENLTSAMRRFYISACYVVYSVNQYACFNDIIECLELYEVRMDFINKIPEEFREFCSNHVENLMKLNAKYTSGDDKGKDNKETVESKIERILDRVSVMRESPRLEKMLTKNPLENVNFENCFNEGKVIVIKMRQDKFGTDHMRNMLSLFFVTRVWEACVNRYSASEGLEGDEAELRRVHLIIDEPHQVPKVLEYMNPIMPQMRKFRLKPVFAIHSLDQIDSIYTSMQNAGFSYMLLAGSDKKNFKILQKDLAPYTVEDLLELERFHSLNLVPDELGILRPFITQLPPKLKV